jgi:hypothetical protein
LGRGYHNPTSTHAGPTYPESLVRGHQTGLVTPPHAHIQLVGLGDGSNPTWAAMDTNLKWLVGHTCSPGVCLCYFYHGAILTIASMDRFHSSFVWIHAHNTGGDQTTTWNNGGTTDARQLVHSASKMHQNATLGGCRPPRPTSPLSNTVSEGLR